jgi:predicted  nucleic acid-binding Zn-ribbon protein
MQNNTKNTKYEPDHELKKTADNLKPKSTEEAVITFSAKKVLIAVTTLNVILFLGGTLYSGIAIKSIMEKYEDAAKYIRNSEKEYLDAKSKLDIASRDIDQLNSKIINTINNNTESVNEKKDEAISLIKGIITILKKIQEKDIPEIEKSVIDIDEKLKNTTPKINNAVEISDQTISTIITAVDESKKATSELNTAIVNANKSTSKLNSAVESEKPVTSKLNTEVDNAKKATSNLKTEIDNAKKATSKLNTDVDNAKKATTKLNTDVDNAKEAASKLNTDIENTKKVTSTLNTDVKKVETAVSEINTAVKTENEKLEKATKKIYDLFDLGESYHKRTTNLEASLTELENKVSNQKSLLSEKQKEIDDLVSRLRERNLKIENALNNLVKDKTLTIFDVWNYSGWILKGFLIIVVLVLVRQVVKFFRFIFKKIS